MPTSTPKEDAIQRVEKGVSQLFEERKRHEEAIQDIDSRLVKLRKKLGGNGPKRSQNQFSQSGKDSVVNFVKKSKTPPSSSDINSHWKEEGRKGNAYVAITQLVKEGKLKRISDSKIKGSRYKTP